MKKKYKVRVIKLLDEKAIKIGSIGTTQEPESWIGTRAVYFKNGYMSLFYKSELEYIKAER